MKPQYIAALVTATGHVRFLVSGSKFSTEFPDAQVFDTINQAKKAAKATGLFSLEIHDRNIYGLGGSLVAVS